MGTTVNIKITIKKNDIPTLQALAAKENLSLNDYLMHTKLDDLKKTKKVIVEFDFQEDKRLPPL